MEKPTPDSAPRILHVSKSGHDENPGTEDTPLLTISSAARLAQPGDTVRVHAGTYRERVDPPRGGSSEDCRITYEAAPGETVAIRGSEIVDNWVRDIASGPGIWKAEIPNTLFADHNPFSVKIAGDWFIANGRPHHTGAVYMDGESLFEAATQDDLAAGFWFAEVEGNVTNLWIHCGNKNPNEQSIEVNVRESVFYPTETGINYITVRGFTMSHAATNWAPPTAEQVGLIGTNWSKGWIIENNTISHSRCVGITLGKYGDEYDNTSADTADGYVKTIERAHQRGWSRESVGSHIVRNNTISHCEQAGIVGSLGAIFSTITDNTIHNIHVLRFFAGHEQAGIKLHAPIDTLIARNHIYRCNRAMWMDWMTQGTRITRNLCHDNIEQDLFLEVNHGPFIVDHNLFLSDMSIFSMSQGGAYVHNLIAGRVSRMVEMGRQTPFHPQSSVEIAGISHIQGGDDRYFNNLFLSAHALESAQSRFDRAGSSATDPDDFETHVPYPGSFQGNQIVANHFRLAEANGQWSLLFDSHGIELQPASLVTTENLGTTQLSKQPFLDTNGERIVFISDYTGSKRTESTVLPGPFAEYPEASTPGSSGPAKGAIGFRKALWGR